METFVFDTCFRNERTSHVEMDREHLSVKYERYTDKISYVPYLFDDPTFVQMFEFLESRCMPRGRTCLQEYLKCMNLTEYNPYEIVRITHGVMWEDFLWLRFPGETITWDEVKVRG